MQRDSLDADRVRAAVGPQWRRVTVVEETASTNADLLAAAAAGAPEYSVLAAEHQAAGRGRLDRTWASPSRAGLTVSVLLRPRVPLAHWGWLPLLAGVALHDAVGRATGVVTALKWPNDLLATDGRKLAGILAQTALDAVVIGIGVNVSTTADELPVPTASSLALAGARNLDRTALVIALLTCLDAQYGQWADAGGDAAACGLAAAYRAACATMGSPVRVELGAATAIDGTAEDVDDLGRLVIRTQDGRQALSAGDVHHLRAMRG